MQDVPGVAGVLNIYTLCLCLSGTFQALMFLCSC